jgi:hypothetical protein
MYPPAYAVKCIIAPLALLAQTSSHHHRTTEPRLADSDPTVFADAERRPYVTPKRVTPGDRVTTAPPARFVSRRPHGAPAKEALMHKNVTRAHALSGAGVAAIAALATLFACSATEPSATTAAATGKAASAIQSAPGSPVSVLTSGGTFWFVLDESPGVAASVREECAKGSADPGSVAKCVDRIRQEGDKEGFRFSGSDPARLVWTSFGVGSGAEEVFLEVPLAVTAVDRGRVEMRATGAPSGSRVPPKADALPFAFEVVDANTIAMVDPDRGRMVFRAR